MGMFDTVVVLDESLRCPYGHRLGGFQTKSFPDPTMETYLFEGARVYLVARSGLAGSNHEAEWRLEGNEAVFRRRHAVETIVPPREIIFYTSCDECAPVLVRCDHPRMWGDLIEECQLWVEFRARSIWADSEHIERTSGTRDDLVTELRQDGLQVIRDDELLALAHREIRAARDARPALRRRRR
jgi:hypothetical protein